MMVEGLSFVLISLATNRMTKLLSRPVQMISLLSLALVEVMFWLFWTPHEGQLWVLFVIAGILGVSKGTLIIQTQGMYPILICLSI